MLSGETEFTIEDQKLLVKEKRALRIPKNTTYSYKPVKDKIELIEFNIPSYDEKYEEVDL